VPQIRAATSNNGYDQRGLAATLEPLETVGRLFIERSRLAAAAMLIEPRLNEKQRRAAEVTELTDAAARVFAFLERYFQRPPPLIGWTREAREGVAAMFAGRHPERRLRALGRRTDAAIDSHLEAVRASTEGIALLQPVAQLVARLPRSGDEESRMMVRRRIRVDFPVFPNGPVKVMEGPVRGGLDPVFEPTHSLLDTPPPAYGDQPQQAVPSFWVLAAKEAMAADLCALCVVEYDGMPAAFYADLGKQAWDETRHAIAYLELAIGLLPELEHSIDVDHELARVLGRFRTAGRGLPVPLERTLYEAFWTANLPQRLILMQIDTKEPGVGTIRAQAQSGYALDHPAIGAVLEVLMHDEITHAEMATGGCATCCPILPRETISSTRHGCCAAC